MLLVQLSDPHILEEGELLVGSVDTAAFLVESPDEAERAREFAARWDVDVHEVMSGLAFGEGPRWRDGHLWVSDMHAGRVLPTKEFTVGNVRRIADEVLADPALDAGLARLRASFAESGGPQAGVRAIEGLLR